MKKNSRWLLAALPITLWFGAAEAQTVRNVRAAQRAGTKLVDVYYDLSGGSGPSTVAVAVSDNGGSSYMVTAGSVSGDVGGGVNAGLNKHVVWNAGADWNGQFSQAVRFRITASGPPVDFVFIPAGTFTYGFAPQVSVNVSAFYMAKYEVTKALWNEVRIWGLANGYTDLPTGIGKATNHPVVSVSWYDVVKWSNARSQKEGFTPCYTVLGVTYRTGNSDAVACNWNANGYRLPTDAEWEKAARGGQSGLRFPWGDTINHSHANYRAGGSYSYDTSGYTSPTYHPSYWFDAVPYTSPVGRFAANGYGLHDMAGNSYEWCWDWWYDGTYYTSGASDPRGPVSGTGRVRRGGSWGSTAFFCQAATRASALPVNTGSNAGFRLALSSVP